MEKAFCLFLNYNFVLFDLGAEGINDIFSLLSSLISGWVFISLFNENFNFDVSLILFNIFFLK